MSSIALTSRHASAAPGGAQQVEARRVAVEHLEAELAQELDLVGVVVEHDGAHAAGEQQPADDLPEAPEARDDHRIAGFLDLVVGALATRRPASAASLSCSEQHERRGRHRQRHGDRELRPPRSADSTPRRLRDAEHHERELAALREQRGEEPALARADAHRRAPTTHSVASFSASSPASIAAIAAARARAGRSRWTCRPR